MKLIFKPLQYIYYAVAIVALTYLLFNNVYCDNNTQGYNLFGKSPIIDKEKVFPGYTLIAPYTKTEDQNQAGDIYLINMYGKPVHIWKTVYKPFHAFLTKDAHLMVALSIPSAGRDKDLPAGNALTGVIQELDWKGQIIWEYRNDMLHHSFELLPNGNIAAVVWQKTPPEIANRIQGGLKGTELNGVVWSDALIEINRKGEIVYTWNAYDYLNPDEDTINPAATRIEWTHTNAIQYISEDPFEGKEAYLLTIPYIDKVILVQKETGKILWKSKIVLGRPHDGTLLANGHILIYDNGFLTSRPSTSNSIVELDPKTDKVIWRFNGGTSIAHALFSSSIAGGVQRLANGNTLITESTRGRLMEVTPQREVVLDLINPHIVYSDKANIPNNYIFKARRYAEGDIKWPEKLNNPMPVLAEYCYATR